MIKDLTKKFSLQVSNGGDIFRKYLGFGVEFWTPLRNQYAITVLFFLWRITVWYDKSK